MQLLLHGNRWWLLIEHDSIGQPQGLLRYLELEAVHVFQREQRRGRSVERHCAAIASAQLLEQCCGGLCFGNDLPSQLALSHLPGDGARPQLVLLRLRCSPAVMADIRRELDRFQPSAVRLAAALPGDSWGRAERGSKGLRAGDDPHYPYPVEVALPAWVLEQDQELRRWLFSTSGLVLQILRQCSWGKWRKASTSSRAASITGTAAGNCLRSISVTRCQWPRT